MKVVTIQDSGSGSFARILPELGFNCFQFQAATMSGERVEVIEAGEGFELGGLPPSHNGIPILFPFPNRISQSRFSWDGQDYELAQGIVPDDGAGNAIHGFCIDRPWRIVNQTEESVTGEFQLGVDAPERLDLWPSDALIRIRYSITGASLQAEITVTNPGEKYLPWGFGTHAYFKVPLKSGGSPGNCTVYAPVSSIWELNRCLPTGQQRPIPDDVQLAESPYFDLLRVDAVFTGIKLQDGEVICRVLDEQAGLQMEQRCCSSFREIVAFTPPWASAICLEPYTCVTDAINLQQKGVDAGLRVLAPGESWNGWIKIQVTPVLC